jgi:RNA polymerase sigma-70 factor, ECF subfamily
MESHAELRPYLFAIAYRMLGSVAEAEDVVQEAFLRYHASAVEAESPKAFLATVTTRLAIDELRSARARREVYPGQWLPEPIVDDEAVRHAETADSLSLAFLHLLEKLSPVERAEVARRFLAAWEEGDTDGLVELLAADATVYGDGGGKAPSMPLPLVGAERVAKALVGWGLKARERSFVHHAALVNGEPGLVFYDASGRALWVAALEIADGVVVAVRSVLNPDKLRHVRPLA